MSRITQIAQAVTDELNNGNFPVPLHATRHYQPVYELQEMQSLHITVVPRGVVSSVLDRSRAQHDVQVDIAVQKKFTADTPEVLDPLMDLVQQIADYFQMRPLPGVGALWVKTENKPIYAPEHMQELRQFTSVLTLTYRVTG